MSTQTHKILVGSTKATANPFFVLKTLLSLHKHQVDVCNAKKDPKIHFFSSFPFTNTWPTSVTRGQTKIQVSSFFAFSNSWLTSVTRSPKKSFFPFTNTFADVCHPKSDKNSVFLFLSLHKHLADFCHAKSDKNSIFSLFFASKTAQRSVSRARSTKTRQNSIFSFRRHRQLFVVIRTFTK